MPERDQNFRIRPCRPGDESAIARIKISAIAEGALLGERIGDVVRWTESLEVDPSGVIVAATGGEVVGFLDPDSHIVAVQPQSRRQGIGSRLVEFGEMSVDQLTIWLPDDNLVASAFLNAIDYVYFASLWELSLPPDIASPEPEFPPGLHLSTWSEEVDVDEFVALFNSAFRDHPTPIRVTRDLVEWTHARTGESPLPELLVRAGDRHGPLIGFVRARTFSGEAESTGEVDFIGVSQEWRGRGIGRALLLWGVESLRAYGAGRVNLRVESENIGALELYKRCGFAPRHEWRRFARRG